MRRARRPRTCGSLAIVAFLLLPAPSVRADEIVRWVDDEGRVHFGNRAVARGQPVDPSKSSRVNTIETPGGKARSAASGQPDLPYGCDDEFKQGEEYRAMDVYQRMDHDSRCAKEILARRLQAIELRAAEEEQRKKEEREKAERRRLADEYVVSEYERKTGRPRREAEAHARREKWCQETYGFSCEFLESWQERAIESCRRRNLSRDCESPAYIAEHRPRTIGEKKAIRRQRYLDSLRREREKYGHPWPTHSKLPDVVVPMPSP